MTFNEWLGQYMEEQEIPHIKLWNKITLEAAWNAGIKEGKRQEFDRLDKGGYPLA